MQRYTDQQAVRPTIENQGRKSNTLTEKSKSHKKTKFMNSDRHFFQSLQNLGRIVVPSGTCFKESQLANDDIACSIDFPIVAY